MSSLHSLFLAKLLAHGSIASVSLVHCSELGVLLAMVLQGGPMAFWAH